MKPPRTKDENHRYLQSEQETEQNIRSDRFINVEIKRKDSAYVQLTQVQIYCGFYVYTSYFVLEPLLSEPEIELPPKVRVAFLVSS